jgi:signal transduction histidine kinase
VRPRRPAAATSPCAARRPTTTVRLVIADDGPGIERAHLPNIFDPFFTTKRSGTGLGLATCHAIVAEHGGSIDVDSELGQGATFTFARVRLPRAASAHE